VLVVLTTVVVTILLAVPLCNSERVLSEQDRAASRRLPKAAINLLRAMTTRQRALRRGDQLGHGRRSLTPMVVLTGPTRHSTQTDVIRLQRRDRHGERQCRRRRLQALAVTYPAFKVTLQTVKDLTRRHGPQPR